MIELRLEWREVLWWMRGGMAGSHLGWSVYKDMVNRVWPQCTEQERRNIHYIMERDFGTHWRNSDDDWKPESEISDKTPFEYFRQVLARFDPDNQYAVTLRIHNQKELDGVLRDRHMGVLIDWPKMSHVRGVDWESVTTTVTVRSYLWNGEYRIDWLRRCAEDIITKVEKLTIPDDGTM